MLGVGHGDKRGIPGRGDSGERGTPGREDLGRTRCWEGEDGERDLSDQMEVGPWGQEFSELWCLLQVLEARTSKQGEGLSCYPAEGHCSCQKQEEHKGRSRARETGLFRFVPVESRGGEYNKNKNKGVPGGLSLLIICLRLGS